MALPPPLSPAPKWNPRPVAMMCAPPRSFPVRHRPLIVSRDGRGRPPRVSGLDTHACALPPSRNSIVHGPHYTARAAACTPGSSSAGLCKRGSRSGQAGNRFRSHAVRSECGLFGRPLLSGAVTFAQVGLPNQPRINSRSCSAAVYLLSLYPIFN